MVILYGYKKIKRVKGRTRTMIHCQNCGSDTQWQFIHLWTWATLFYIPFLPVWRNKMLICPSCNCGVKINKENENLLSEVDFNR